MLFLISDLIKSLNEFQKIIIYGAGMYASEVYPYLKRAGMKEKIITFVVTERENNIETIDEIPIKRFDDFEFANQENICVLISVSNRFVSEIEEKLKTKKLKNILRLVDFELSNLKNVSDEKFLKGIIEKNIWNYVNSMQEAAKEEQRINDYLEKRNRFNSDKKQIVFIVGNLSVRIVKIINALIEKGFNLILLRYGNIENKLSLDELLVKKLTYIECMGIEMLFFQAIQYNPIVYFFEPIWGDCSWAEIMIRHEKVFGRVVISLYDVLNDGYAFVSDKMKYTEKYVLENASGVVWRYYSKEYLEKEKGFFFKGKSVHFLDYCTGYQIKRKQEENLYLKLCCVTGDLHPFFCDSKVSGCYIREAQFVKILNKIGNRTDCIFHVFTGQASQENKQLCDSLEKQYKNFKVIYGTKHDELIEKISAYDYGCFLFDGEDEIPNTLTVDNKYYGSQYINAVSNRYFDYIDAEIPLIGTRPLKLCHFFDKYGVIVKMNLTDLNIGYLLQNKVEYKKRVKKAKEELLVGKRISTLINFFNNI